jgi:energy-coupling factor transport system ATP-binding protein
MAFAAGFLMLRLAYRVVFGGWPESLDGWAGLIAAVFRASAPFMAIIVAFGALNTIFDLQQALSRWGGRGPLRNLRTALVISLSSFPALRESVRLVRDSRRMRGDRSAGSLVMPVLERAVERGLTLGSAMEQRGFGARDFDFGMCDAPVSARDLRIGFGPVSQPTWVLEVGNLVIEHGSCVLLTGPTGSGKTALLRSLSGRLQHSAGGWQQGVLEVGGLDRRVQVPSESAAFVSFVEQNVRDGFVASTVFDEIAFSLRMLGKSESSIDAAVVGISSRVGVSELLTRETGELSAGEASLVALAAALVTQPSLLLLDEPVADLDENAATRVIELLAQLRESTGITMVIAEHRWEPLREFADRRLDLGVEAAPETRIEPGAGFGSAPGPALGSALGSAGRRITPLVAPNGAGKTTWLRSFASSHARNVRLVPEDPSLLFSRESVAGECAHNDRLARVAPGTTRTLALRLVASIPMDAHPRDLSTGQRLALACALQVAVQPDLLLLDEPTRGLDSPARAELARMLDELASTGTAVIFATHDREFAKRFSALVVPS